MQVPIEWLPESGAPEQLILMLHGWGSNGAAMAPLAQALRGAFPQAALLAPDAPLPWDRAEVAVDGVAAAAQARQWYGIEGLDEQNWPARVAPVLPALQAWVGQQQQRLGVGAAATALAGFSQGAILALALALQDDGIAGRVLAFGGRLVGHPAAAPQLTTLHFIHGGDDAVIPAEHARQALQWLGALQGDATLDVAQGVGHELHPALIDCALHRLKNHIPLRLWRAAMGDQPPPH